MKEKGGLTSLTLTCYEKETAGWDGVEEFTLKGTSVLNWGELSRQK